MRREREKEREREGEREEREGERGCNATNNISIAAAVEALAQREGP